MKQIRCGGTITALVYAYACTHRYRERLSRGSQLRFCVKRHDTNYAMRISTPRPVELIADVFEIVFIPPHLPPIGQREFSRGNIYCNIPEANWLAASTPPYHKLYRERDGVSPVSRLLSFTTRPRLLLLVFTSHVLHPYQKQHRYTHHTLAYNRHRIHNRRP